MFFDPAIVATLKLKEKPSVPDKDTSTKGLRFTLFSSEKKTKRSKRQSSYNLQRK